MGRRGTLTTPRRPSIFNGSAGRDTGGAMLRAVGDLPSIVRRPVEHGLGGGVEGMPSFLTFPHGTG